MVEEMASQLGKKPDLIVLSVGGGGLMCGILKGLHRVGWNDVPVLAMETHGANSFAESLKAGKPIILPRITRYLTSICFNLGSKLDSYCRRLTALVSLHSSYLMSFDQG